MKIVSIIGARPQFIKAAVVSKAFEELGGITEVLVHTGQHYDENMSKIFFDELEIKKPDYNLEVGSGSHAVQTGMMMIKIEEVLIKEKPDWVLVYGDTNSTIAGSLTAAKLHINIAHVEAGLRSFNMLMPEEVNRILTDRISTLLFAPTKNAISLLRKEGIETNVVFSGDVMYDSILHYSQLAEKKKSISDIIDLDKFYLGTIHRPANTDNRERLQSIFSAFSELDLPIVLPLHPRTKGLLAGIKYSDNVKVIDPVGYLEMILLLKNAVKVLTDSGGLQKEAYFMKKPCVTLRDETEWIETLEGNWNFIVGADKDLILEKIKVNDFGKQNNAFGDGHAGELIAKTLIDNFKVAK
jgi:UDP-GlcNAc3NAcA epimerase